MKQPKFVLSILLLTTLIAFGQKPNANNTVDNQLEIINNLKKTVNQKWIRQNPELNSTKVSFFNKDNATKYFVCLSQISGQGSPLTWDDDLSFIKFLLDINNKTTVKHGIDADAIYKGTKITWNQKINGLIWFNEKTYKTSVDKWYLFGLNDCVGTIKFPFVSFEKVTEIPNVISNSIQGLIILPYIENIKIKSAKTLMRAKNGKIYNGIGYDLDKDAIFDIFTYNEIIDETTSYTRLYLNVAGKWKCKWINLNEECL